MWGEIVNHLPSFESAVLTGLDGEGYPYSVRCRPYTDPVRRVLRMRLPDGIPVQPGPASLLCHKHDESMWNLKSFLVRGELSRDARGWSLSPRRVVRGGRDRGSYGYGPLPNRVAQKRQTLLEKTRASPPAHPLGGDRGDQSSRRAVERRGGDAENPVAMSRLPLNQLPDLRLELAFLSDLGEDLHSPLEVRHGLLTPAGGVQQVGEVVVQSRLAMSIS